MSIADTQYDLYKEGVFFLPIFTGFASSGMVLWVIGLPLGVTEVSDWGLALFLPVFGFVFGGLMDWLARKIGLLPSGGGSE